MQNEKVTNANLDQDELNIILDFLWKRRIALAYDIDCANSIVEIQRIEKLANQNADMIDKIKYLNGLGLAQIENDLMSNLMGVMEKMEAQQEASKKIASIISHQ